MKYFPDIILVIGGATLSFGAMLMYEPAGFIVAGILLLIVGIKASK